MEVRVEVQVEVRVPVRVRVRVQARVCCTGAVVCAREKMACCVSECWCAKKRRAAGEKQHAQGGPATRSCTRAWGGAHRDHAVVVCTAVMCVYAWVCV